MLWCGKDEVIGKGAPHRCYCEKASGKESKRSLKSGAMLRRPFGFFAKRRTGQNG